jgi:hypothetical protein
MFQKPSYCCNCGDKVERIEWHLWNSRRYCELCETEYQFDEWWPRIAMTLIFTFGITGIGFHYIGNREPKIVEYVSKPVVSRSLKSGGRRERKKTAATVTPDRSQAPTSVASDEKNGVEALEFTGASKEATVSAPKIVENEEVVFCGALTKKGKPCSRRVKGGGRCWQHKEPD